MNAITSVCGNIIEKNGIYKTHYFNHLLILFTNIV